MSSRYLLQRRRLACMRARGVGGKLLRIQMRRRGLAPLFGRRCRAWEARGGQHG